MTALFELDWLGGWSERRLRRRRPGIDDLPWGSLEAAPLAAPLWPVLGMQIAGSVMMFPLAARLVAWVDRRRTRGELSGGRL